MNCSHNRYYEMFMTTINSVSWQTHGYTKVNMIRLTLDTNALSGEVLKVSAVRFKLFPSEPISVRSDPQSDVSGRVLFSSDFANFMFQFQSHSYKIWSP